MQRTKTQFVRLIELDRLIREDKYPNALSFSKEWGVSQKTAQRDIEYLRDQHNAPMEYDRFSKGYRYTDKNWFLPAFNLSEKELRALLLAKLIVRAYGDTGIAAEMSNITDKLTEFLTGRLPFQPEVIFSRFSFVNPPAKPVNGNIWSTIVNGLLTQRSIQIQYRSLNTGQSSERVIDPYHVANLQGEWYVIAWCHKAKELRQFGIPQMQKAKLMAGGFEVKHDFDPQKLLGSAFRRQMLGGKVQQVKLRFDKAVASQVTARQWQPKQKTKVLSNGDVEITFSSVGLFEISRWVLTWGHNVKILGPAQLKQMVREEIRLMARMK
jgi:predicted DNA-binding transcriptional regulator YafY